MTTVIQLEHSRAEGLTQYLDFTPQLASSETLIGQGCVVTHTPPSGTPVVVTPNLVGTLVRVPIPDDLVLGVHRFSCVATTTDVQNTPEILLIITVLR